MKVTIENYRPATWNTIYSARSFWTRKKVVDEIHSLVKHSCHQALRTQTIPNGLVDIHIDVYFDKRPYDSSNIPIKIFEDGLKGIIIRDDNISCVRRVSSQSHKDSNKRVEITITPVVL